MNANCKIAPIGLGLVFFGLTVSAQNTSELIDDQVASHFNQVFSDKSSAYSPDKKSWVPGNDRGSPVLGSLWSLEANTTQVLETNINKHNNHDVEVEHIETGLNVKIPLKPRHTLSFALNSTLYRLKEDSGEEANLIPFDKALKIDAGFMYRWGVSPRWELLMGGGSSFTDSNESGLGGKTTWLAYGGAAYSFSPDLTLVVAQSFTSRTFEGKSPFPLIVLDWRINDRSRLQVGDGVSYKYALTDNWRDVISLDATGAVLTLHMEDREIGGEFHSDPALVVLDSSLAASYSHTFSNGLVFTSRVGLVHYGRHTYYDEGDEISYLEFEPSMGFSFGLRYHF